MPEVKNYSQAKSIAKALLGPKVRVWRYDNIITIGLYGENNQRMVLGEAKDYTTALKMVAFTLATAKAKQAGVLKTEEKVAEAVGKEGSKEDSVVGR